MRICTKRGKKIQLRSNHVREDTDYTADGRFQGWTRVGREAFTVHLLHLGEVRRGITWMVLLIQKKAKILKQNMERQWLSTILNHESHIKAFTKASCPSGNKSRKKQKIRKCPCRFGLKAVLQNNNESHETPWFVLNLRAVWKEKSLRSQVLTTQRTPAPRFGPSSCWGTGKRGGL